MISKLPFPTLVVAVLLVFGLAGSAGAATLDDILDHYQDVRLALVDDRVDTASARSLDAALDTLRNDLSAEAAAVDPASIDAARELLDEIHAAARSLVDAGADLKAARDALYQLSQPLVRYRELMVGDDKPAVAYCPMAKKSWLQLETDTIGNPYHGQSMPRCGSIVSD